MPSTKCSVLGCTSKERKHVFPQNDDDFNTWLLRCNNNKLFNLDKHVVRQRYAVCHVHFNRSCESPGTKKLKKESLPTLYLPSNNYANIVFYNIVNMFVLACLRSIICGMYIVLKACFMFL